MSVINFLLLVELIVVVIAASAFLFYWNRILASIVAFIIRLFTWRSYSAFISIGSLQISPLAGRISFRDVEYHSSNISFRALHGHVTFRYWIFRVRQEVDSQSDNPKRNRLPCRIHVYAEGVECFVYNRTPAYDAIVERMKKHETESPNRSDETLAKAKSSGLTGGEADQGFGARLRRVAKSANSAQETASSSDSTRKPEIDPHALPLQPKPVKTPAVPGVNWFREALPVELHVVNGSLILGSDSTPTLLINSFHRADGTLEISDSRSICDEYKLSANLTFEQPTVLMRTNVDYSGPILAHGKKVYDELYKQEPDITKQPPSKLSSFLGFHALSSRSAFIRNPKFSTPPVAGLPTDRPWRGLARYRIHGENTPRLPKREDREYAKVTTLVQAESLLFTYYADTPGPVPEPAEAQYVDEKDEYGNIDLPPEYGIDITIRAGTVNYGPWSDRQRDALQKTFAPSIFFDSEPKPRLRPGDTRVHSNLVVNVQFEDRTTLRIPTREPSKDWEYEHKGKEEVRRYGWLDVVVGPNSSIVYTQSQLATSRGYDAVLTLHLESLAISSSVNYLTFVEAKSCKLYMTMPTPLSWNARRDWGLDLTLDTPEVYLLRDHVQVISDLAKDWSSGQVGDFHHFVPNHYNFRIALLNYAFHLCLNDFNIIDFPLSREHNAFMDVKGPKMEAFVAVDSTQYRADLSTIPFSVSAHDAVVEMSLPSWDTHRSFSESASVEVGKIGEVSARGTYTFYSHPHPDHQETLMLHLEGRHVVFKALGWVLRRMFCTKDNYFGAFTQFATSQEFVERFDHDPNSVGDPVEAKYRPGRSDAFAVNVTMNVEESLILMSDEIYSCDRGLAMPVPQLQMSLKSVEHFMELSLDAMPTYIVAVEDFAKSYDCGQAPPIQSKESIFVEGIELRANRLFGPQPRATTYLCLWEFVSPRITAFLSPQFLSTIKAAVSAVAYNFTDVENAPASFYMPKTPPDATFFKLGINQVSATIFTENGSALSLDLTDGVSLDTSSLSSRSFKSAVGLILPSIAVVVLERDTFQRKWTPVGSIRTSLAMDVYSAPTGWQEKASQQQQFLTKEDKPTRRLSYMYSENYELGTGHYVHTAFVPQPRPADRPLEDDQASSRSTEIDTFVSGVESPRPQSSDESEVDETYTNGRFTHSRQRSRSVATPQEIPAYSAGEESDSTSEGSTSTSSIATSKKLNTGKDVAVALAERLRGFRSTRDRALPRFDEWRDEPDSKPLQELFQNKIQNGSIIRVVPRSIDVRLSTKTVSSVSQILDALQAVTPTPEVQLEQMMINHSEDVLADIAAKDPTLIDVSVHRLRVIIDTPVSDDESDPIEAILGDITASILVSPERPERPKSLDVTMAARSTEVVVRTSHLKDGQVSLEIPDSGEALRRPTRPVMKISLGDFGFGLHQSTEQHYRARASSIDVQVVNATASAVIEVGKIWRSTMASISKPASTISPSATLLYKIIEAAGKDDVTLTAPAFLFDSGYELHAQDQRNIRRNPGWLMLSRLRYWLRQCKLSESAIPELSMDEMTSRIISEMIRLEDAFCGDESLVLFQPFIKRSLGSTITAPSEPASSDAVKTTGFFASLGQVTLGHHGRLLESAAVASSKLSFTGATTGFERTAFKRDDKDIEQTRLVVGMKGIQSELHDSLLPGIETLLKLAPRAKENTPILDVEDSAEPEAMISVDVHLQSADISVLAGGLRLRLAVKHLEHAMARRSSNRQNGDDRRKISHDSVFACCEAMNLALLQPKDDHDLVANSPDRIVTFLDISGVRINVDNRSLGIKDKPTVTRIIFGVKNVEFDSRPQLRAFLAFARDWQKEHLNQYRPVIHDIRELVSGKRQRIVANTSLPPQVQLDLSVGRLHLQIRAAKAVWLRWDIGKVFISHHGCESDIRFGLRFAPQTVGAYTTMKRSKDRGASSIKLPSFTAIGFHKTTNGRPHISATVTLGFFVGVLKPAVLDRLLSLHQRLGSDIMHIVQEYRETVRQELRSHQAKYAQRPPTTVSEDTEPIPTGYKLLMDLQVSVAGVRFGLKADDVSTTLLLEALALRGQVTNTSTEHAELLWRAKVDHFGLSLGHLGTEISDEAEPIRKHRTAYMMLDVDVQEIPGQQGLASQLNVSLNRVHTVMHVAALSELSELIRSWQSDIHILRDNRASEVAEVKSTTSKIFKKLEAGDKPIQPEESWFANRFFTINLVGFGIAIPLDEAAAIDLRHRDNILVPALLFSVRVLSFQNRKNETARFKMQQMALQVLEKFDQGAPEHFRGDYHPSTNRMLLPSLDSEAQMASAVDAWVLSAHCSASDFKLSLAPDIVEGAFKLIDLYESGKDRLAELEQQYRAEMAKREAPESVAAKYEDTPTPSPTRTRQRIIVRMSYTFNSGIVEMHRSPDSSGNPCGTTPRGRTYHDTFVLPTISVWMDYEGPQTDLALEEDERSGSLIFNAAVHESKNTLRPTILPFFCELFNRIEKRHRSRPRSRSLVAAERKAQLVAASVSESTLQAIASTPGAKIKLRVTLRIDRSELRLSCAPDSNAYVDLKWESGGFMASTSLGGHDASTVAGSVSGVTASMSHEFAELGRSCVEASAKDLAFTVAYCSDHDGGEKGLSVVFDSQLAGQFRLDAFSAWLIFTSVWIENAPPLNVPLHTAIPEAASSDKLVSSNDIASHVQSVPLSPTQIPKDRAQLGGLSSNERGGPIAVLEPESDSAVEDEPLREKKKLVVAAIVRFRAIDFDANISISRTHVRISPIILRTISNGEKTEVDLQIGKTEVTAKGDISGNLCSDRLTFNTLRLSSRATEETSTVLAMSIDAGDLRGNLFLGEVNILRFHLEPAVVTLADDWTGYTGEPDSQVSLAFAVKAGHFAGVLRLLAIPRLLGNLYSMLDMVDSQQRIAIQRSEIFKASQRRKKEDPSPMAAVILHTARRASAAAGIGHVRTAQTMRFDLSGIDIGVFNEDYEAGGHVADFYRFVVGKVEADLKRQSSTEGIPMRDLGLLISLVQWDTSDGAKAAAREQREMGAKELIELAWRQGHKSVASLPSMTMNMASRELSTPPVLDFDFDLVWGETDGDIGILPNFFEQAISAFRKLIKGLDEQELARLRRTDPSASPNMDKNRRASLAEHEPLVVGSTLEYRPRDPTWADDPPIPKLKQLGESTREAATFIPRIKSATKELPILSHRFVTLPLEEGMDLLLKLYEKQLPERPM